MYESGEGERRGIVEEEVVDVIKEETDRMSRVGAVFVSLSRRLASADSSVRSVLSTLSCNTTQRQVHRDSQATGALHCIPQFYRRGVREEIASEWARSYCTSSNFHRHHAVSEFPAMISITPSYALFGCAALSTQMGHITVPVGMSLNASAPTVLHPERVLVLLTTYSSLGITSLILQ